MAPRASGFDDMTVNVMHQVAVLLHVTRELQ